MTFQIRPITEAEFSDYTQIRSEAYHAPYDELFKLRHLTDLNETRCVFVDEEMRATGRLFRFEQNVHGRFVPMGGVASIAVRMDERGKGHIRQVIGHMLRELRADGVPVSVLYPSVHALYRRFGYAIASELRTVTVRNQREALFLESLPRPQGTVRRADTEELEAMALALYNQAAAQHHGNLRRSDVSYWEHRILFKGETTKSDRRTLFLYFDTENKPQGYLLLNPKDNGTVRIKELIALTFEAQLGLLQLLQQDNILTEFTWNTDLNSDLPALLYNPKSVDTKIQAEWMARIVDVRTAWTILSPHATSGRVRLGVVDAMCDWNQGTFDLHVADGQAQVTETTEAPQAVADIGTWSQLLYGYLTVEQALFTGSLQVHDPAVLPFLRALWRTDVKPFSHDPF